MKLEELLANNPDTLEKLSDAELTQILAPYFRVTRPDESKRKQAQASNISPTPRKSGPSKSEKIKNLDNMLAKLGL